MADAGGADTHRLWREESQAPLPALHEPRSRARGIFITLILAMAVVGGLVGVLFWIRPVAEPHFVPIWITEYKSLAVPPLPQAENERAALGKARYFEHERNDAFTNQESALLLQQLLALQRSEQAVVVYLSAHAVRTGKDVVEIMAADADPKNPQARLPLAQVLAALKECRSTQKLLILDIAHALIDPTLGILSTDVAEAVPALVARNADPQLWVLTSCAPGQVGWSTEVLGRSAFAYYIEEGLRGAAEGYNEGQRLDGSIHVRELAAFVRARVARWALAVKGEKQTPQLLGSGKNFVLRVLDDRRWPAPLALPAAPKYPAWLTQAWTTHQEAWTTRAYGMAPYLFQRQAALLVRAEEQWRHGMAEDRIRANELALALRLQQRMAVVQTSPQPKLHSLGMVQEEARPEPALTKELDTFFVKWEDVKQSAKPEEVAKTQAKLVTDFRDKLQTYKPLAVSTAVWQKLLTLETPSLERLQLFDALQHAPGTPPAELTETMWLHLLAQRGDPLPWPVETVRLLLQMLDQSGRALAHPRAFPWTKNAQDEAAQQRHVGEIFVWSHGHVSPTETQRILQDALTRFRGIVQQSDDLESAYRLLDEALFVLPCYPPYLRFAPEHEGAWLRTTESTAALWQELTATPVDVGQQIKIVQTHSSQVREGLQQLRKPFTGEALTRLKSKLEEPLVKPGDLREAAAVLRTPLPAPAERALLWQALAGAERRLQEAVRKDDGDDIEAELFTAAPEEDDPQRAAAALYEQARREARWSIALLQLGGFTAEQVELLKERLAKLPSQRGTGNELWELAAALQNAWNAGLREQLQGDMRLAARDRLSRIVPAAVGDPSLDNAERSLPAQQIAEQARVLWTWLAERYRYQARDYRGANLDADVVRTLGQRYAQTASAYDHLAQAPRERYVEIAGGDDLPRLTPLVRTAATTLQLRQLATDTTAAPLLLKTFVPDSQWLRIVPLSQALELAPLPKDPVVRVGKAPLVVEMLPSASSTSMPRPQGFLVQAEAWGRPFHKRIAVPLESAADQLRLVLSSNDASMEPALDTVRVRPGNIPQLVYLHVANPTAQPRKVIVEMKIAGQVLKSGSVALTVPARRSQLVVLPDTGVPPIKTTPPELSPKKEKEDKSDDSARPALPPLAGPIEVRLLDGDARDRVLDSRRIEVDIASPREYVTVSEITFEPPSPANKHKNRLALTLQRLTAVPGPAIPVELELPPDQIPGFLGVKDGTLKSTLANPADPAPTRIGLFAEDIRLARAAEEDGLIYLHVDGYPRAFVFRTTFARAGDVLTPRGEGKPSVRFRTPRFALSNPRFPVTVEVDNAPPDARLEFSLGRFEGAAFKGDLVQTFATAKERHLGFRADPSGAMLFDGALRDWTVVLDTSKIVGQRLLRARLLAVDSSVLAEMIQPLTTANAPPTGVRITVLPEKVKRGSKVPVYASAFETESKLTRVVFYVGKLVDGQVPPKAELIVAQPTDPMQTMWTAALSLPDNKGPLDVTVIATNAVGLQSQHTRTIELVDPMGEPTGPGKIRGKVAQGSLAQPNLEVFLYDVKGTLKGRVKTDKDGNYLFESVEPGRYTVYCIKRDSQRRGRASAIVLPAKEATANIELTL